MPVTKENAPHSVDGINYAPFAAFGGWAGAINAKADQKKKDAAYAFMSYMNQAAQSNVDVTIGATGYNPYRNSQLASTDLWVKAGMPADLAENYLGAINGALNNLNMASDMKIPGAQKYTGVVLDTELARYLAGEITVEEALKNIEAGWEEVTEDFGRDAQIKAQALALGHWLTHRPGRCRPARRHVTRPAGDRIPRLATLSGRRAGVNGLTAIPAPSLLRPPSPSF